MDQAPDGLGHDGRRHLAIFGLSYPLLAVTPALVVPMEWLLLGDRPGLRGVLGIVLVVAGVTLVATG